MSCTPIQEALLEAPATELDTLLAEHGHADCPACTALVARIREQEAALHGTIDAWVAQPPEHTGASEGSVVRLWPAVALALAVAATLALVLGGLFTGSGSSPTVPPDPVVEPPRPAVPAPFAEPNAPEDEEEPQPTEGPEDTDVPTPSTEVTAPIPSPRPTPMPSPRPRPAPGPRPAPRPTPAPVPAPAP